jgi:RNA polymerase sigma factor FliA
MRNPVRECVPIRDASTTAEFSAELSIPTKNDGQRMDIALDPLPAQLPAQLPPQLPPGSPPAPRQSDGAVTALTFDLDGQASPATRAIVAEAEARARRMLDRGDYKTYLPLVRRIAMRLARHVPATITVADLVGYGWVGLMAAYHRTDGRMPDDEFEAYALYRVRGAMLDYLRTLDPATRDLRRASRQITCVIRHLSSRIGREPAEDEIAGALGLDVGAYRSLLDRIAAAGMARLELLDIDDLEPTKISNPIEDEIGKRQLGEALAVAMESLPPRLVQVLALHYQEGCTLKQIGMVLRVGESRVSQLHTEAIHRLRAAVGKA